MSLAPPPSLNDLHKALHQTLRGWRKGKLSTSTILATLWRVRQLQATTEMPLLLPAVRLLINDALTMLQHSNPLGAEVLKWHFMDGMLHKEIAYKAGMAGKEDNIQKLQTTAVRGLAQIVLEIEEQARRQTRDQQMAALQLSTYTELFGVQHHRAALTAALLSTAAPWMITVSGLGGIGKTALTDATVRDVIPTLRYQQVAWVTVKSRAGDGKPPDADAILEAVLAALEKIFFSQRQGQPPGLRNAALRQFLKQHPTLVIVDNIEHRHALPGLLTALADYVQPSRFVLTTRTAPPAAPIVQNFSLTELPLDVAHDLLRYHAHRLGVSELTQGPSALLEQIYTLVGGNPQALILAVVLAGKRSVAQMLANLSQPATQQVEALFQKIYSYLWQTLSDDARQLLHLMVGVAEQGMTAERLQTISELPERPFWAALDELTDSALVEPRNGPKGERRYTLHRLTASFLRSPNLEPE